MVESLVDHWVVNIADSVDEIFTINHISFEHIARNPGQEVLSGTLEVIHGDDHAVPCVPDVDGDVIAKPNFYCLLLVGERSPILAVCCEVFIVLDTFDKQVRDVRVDGCQTKAGHR
jgi:hypothetical protein